MFAVLLPSLVSQGRESNTFELILEGIGRKDRLTADNFLGCEAFPQPLLAFAPRVSLRYLRKRKCLSVSCTKRSLIDKRQLLPFAHHTCTLRETETRRDIASSLT